MAGHTVRTQHSVTASAGQRRGDVMIRSYLQDAAGRRSLVFDLSMTHDRFGSSSHVNQKGLLSHPQDLDAPLRLAAQRKIMNWTTSEKRGSSLGKREDQIRRPTNSIEH